MAVADFKALSDEYRKRLLIAAPRLNPGSPMPGDNVEVMTQWLDGTVGRLIAAVGAQPDFVAATMKNRDGRDRRLEVAVFAPRVVLKMTSNLYFTESSYSVDWVWTAAARNSLRAITSEVGGNLEPNGGAGPRWVPLTAAYDRFELRITPTDANGFTEFYPSLLADLSA